jgi:hypothetical protein
VPRSHPFIIGHRGGRYTLLWGGSAVALPIHELEVGNVTGNGMDNLVVLEGTADGQPRTLSVWHWHGWGYTLLWRSPPAHYRDLVLLAAPDGQKAVYQHGRKPVGTPRAANWKTWRPTLP